MRGTQQNAAWDCRAVQGRDASARPRCCVVAAESVLYRTPMSAARPLSLPPHEPPEPDPTFFVSTDMWDL